MSGARAEGPPVRRRREWDAALSRRRWRRAGGRRAGSGPQRIHLLSGACALVLAVLQQDGPRDEQKLLGHDARDPLGGEPPFLQLPVEADHFGGAPCRAPGGLDQDVVQQLVLPAVRADGLLLFAAAHQVGGESDIGGEMVPVGEAAHVPDFGQEDDSGAEADARDARQVPHFCREAK